MLVVQVKSSLMCTYRNLALSTVEQSMVSVGWGGGGGGGWGVTRVLPEVHHNLLCLTHIEGQVVSTTPFSQLCHFLSV